MDSTLKETLKSIVSRLQSVYDKTTTSASNPLLNKEQIHTLIQQNAAAVIGADSTMTQAFPCYSEGHAQMIGSSQSLEEGNWYKIHNGVVEQCEPYRTEDSESEETENGIYVTTNDNAVVQYDETRMFFNYDSFKYYRVWDSEGGYFVGQSGNLTINFNTTSTPKYMWIKDNPRTDVWYVFALTVPQMIAHSTIYVFEYSSDPGSSPTLDFDNPTATIPIYYPTTKYVCINSSTSSTLPTWAFYCIISEISLNSEQLASLNSGATADKINQIATNTSNITSLGTNKQDKLTAGTNINITNNVISSTTVQSNWTETDTTSEAYIQNKPDLATVATSGSYNDLLNLPTTKTYTVTSSDTIASGNQQHVPLMYVPYNEEVWFTLQVDITTEVSPFSNNNMQPRTIYGHIQTHTTADADNLFDLNKKIITVSNYNPYFSLKGVRNSEGTNVGYALCIDKPSYISSHSGYTVSSLVYSTTCSVAYQKNNGTQQGLPTGYYVITDGRKEPTIVDLSASISNIQSQLYDKLDIEPVISNSNYLHPNYFHNLGTISSNVTLSLSSITSGTAPEFNGQFTTDSSHTVTFPTGVTMVGDTSQVANSTYQFSICNNYGVVIKMS